MQVSNRFFVTAIKDGQVANGYLRCNTSLQQFIDKDTGTCAPDWRVGKQQTGEVQPVITAYTRLGGAIKAPTSNKWYWNGAEIQFNGNNSLITYQMDGQTYPLFVRGTTTVEGESLPTLKINGNLAGATATVDQDVISNQGSISVDGSALDYSMDIVVRISYLVATNGYWGNISYDGNSVITTDDSTQPEGRVVLVPTLYFGTAAMTAQDYTVHWYIEPSTSKGTGSTLTLTASDVVDNVTVRCDFYNKDATPKLLCSAYIEVDDAQDDDEMQIIHPGGQSNANLRKSDVSVTFTIWMSSRTDATEVKADYNRFRMKLLSSQSVDITNQIGTPGADGYLDITQNSGIPLEKDGQPVAGKCGVVTIPFTVASANGDTISGVVIADHYETT